MTDGSTASTFQRMSLTVTNRGEEARDFRAAVSGLRDGLSLTLVPQEWTLDPGEERSRGAEIELDFRSGRVVVRGRPVELSNMEMRLLRYLVEHRGKVLTREELLESVWGHATTLLTRTVDVHIAMLRQKLEENPSRPELIVTVHRAGYKFGG